MTGKTTKLEYALFPNRKAARAAQTQIDAANDGEVELLTDAAALTQDKIPLRHTMAGVGTILGASVGAGLTFATLVGVMILGVDILPQRVPAPYATMAIVVMLAAILGGLAGALSYSTRAREELRGLRELLRFDNSVLLIASEHDLDALLYRHGAVKVGRLA